MARTDQGGGEVDQDDVDSAAVLTLVGEHPEEPTILYSGPAMGAISGIPIDHGCGGLSSSQLAADALRSATPGAMHPKALAALVEFNMEAQAQLNPQGIVSIDPGSSSGAIVATAACWDEPRILRLAKSTDRDIVDFIREVTPYCRYGVIERVSSMPRQGVVSSFKFGASYGGLKMALAMSGLIWGEVTPSQWQRALGCLSKGDKNITKSRAQQLFPNVKVIHHNADALLLNHWGKLHAKWVNRDESGNIAVR